MAWLPGAQAIVVSETAFTNEAEQGLLSVFELSSNERVPIFAGGEGRSEDQRWGDPDCTQPPGEQFNPHGIDLIERSDGKLQLLVVQHGGRESMEFFEVNGEGERWSLTWRGCTLAPEDTGFNSVAADTTGGYYTTKPFPQSQTAEFFADPERFIRSTKGVVYFWSQAEGFRVVSGAEGSMPNGIATTPDGSVMYVTYSGESKVRKIDTATGTVLAEIDVPTPDNIKWTADGKSLTVAAALHAFSDSMALGAECIKNNSHYCPGPFSIVEIDPVDLSSREVFSDPRVPFGAGTVGLKNGNQLIVGSILGNRILRVHLQE